MGNRRSGRGRGRLASARGVLFGIIAMCIEGGVLLLEQLAAADFSEEAGERGLIYFVSEGLFGGPGSYGCGVALVDLDEDLDPDAVALGNPAIGIGVWENDGTGHFVDRTPDLGVPVLALCSGVVAGDYDNDGDLDLYLSRWNVDDVLLRNDGGFAFTDVTIAAGLGGNAGPGAGCAFADFDLDGDLDLYLANRTIPWPSPTKNRLYRNLGNGTFEDVAPDLGLDLGWFSFQPAFFDMDLDGDADLYVTTDKGLNGISSNRLFRNQGGAFEDLTASSGAGIVSDYMGLAVGDFDGNGLPDLYCTNIPLGNALLLNVDGEHFVDSTAVAGLGSYATGWGADFLDYDLDGDLDLYVCNMSGLSGANRLYRNGFDWPCPDVAAEEGVGPSHNYFCMATADVDLDGDLDLLLQRYQGPIELYINQRSDGARWMRLTIVGEAPQHMAVGAVVHAKGGGLSMHREVRSGTAYKSQNELPVHLGWGDVRIAESIAVTWPGGTHRVMLNVPTNSTWTILPPSRLGDADGDGDWDALDALALLQCLGPVETGCEALDLTGDWIVDEMDAWALVALLPAPVADCDLDGVPDLVALASGKSVDRDGNGIPDGCFSSAFPGDLDGNGMVNGADLGILLSAWGPCGGCAEDLDGDGTVDGTDLGVLFGNWNG